MALAEIKNCEDIDEELFEVLRFLSKRFEEHREIYGSSFAQQLNNEAAVEMAEVIFSPEAVIKARQHLKYGKAVLERET